MVPFSGSSICGGSSNAPKTRWIAKPGVIKIFLALVFFSLHPAIRLFAQASVSPASVTWASVPVGNKGGQKVVTLTNGGSAAISISSIAFSGANPGDFQIFSKTCGTSLGAAASCTANIVFAPSTAGVRTATLSFTDTASNSPQTVALSGTGTAGASVTPTALSFGGINVGSSSAAQSVTLKNGGTATISISSIAISGTNAGDFSISSNACGSSLASSASCAVGVVFKPAASGTRSANLVFTDTASNNPQTVPLSGSGNGTTFTIQPTNPTVTEGGTLQFSATTSVTWTASCGTIGSTSGSYTAPFAAESCTVTARETASPNSTVSTVAKVTAPSGGTLTIYPSSADVVSGTQQIFQAQLSKVPDTAHSLTYSVDGVVGGNSTTGTITNQGVYTAPSATGNHTVSVTDNTLGTSASSNVYAYSTVWIDFGSRTTTVNPVPAGLFGAQRLESLHNAADLDLVKAGGITYERLWAQVAAVFATTTPNWNAIDSSIKAVTATGGVHVILEMYQTPTWLQSSSSCGAYSLPTNLNSWASIAAQYVQHMDATFPGIVTDYEIWNEPDINLCVPAGDSRLTDYLNLYKAAVPQMKAQAKADGKTIRVGGPVSAGLDAPWVSAMLSDATVAQNIDFMSYHNYLMGGNQLGATWDTYNGTESVYQVTQDDLGPSNTYAYAGTLAAGGKQPQGKNLPIYITEYNLNWTFNKNCCQNDPTYGPLWNALVVADLLNEPFAYSGAPNSISKLIYYAATAPPYYCLIGEIDTNMDCTYPAGSTPQPYPQYFAYQLYGSPSYLGLQNGGYMAASSYPGNMGAGLVVTAFYTSTLDAIVLINPTPNTYTNMPINIANTGYSSAQGTLYKIVNGQSIQSSTASLQSQGGTTYTTTVSMGPYSVQAISVHP